MEEDASWLANTEIVLMPMANPDGFQHTLTEQRLWRKNRRPSSKKPQCPGVDLNRNFPIDWNGSQSTSQDPCSGVYVGTSAFSEPEAQVLARVMEEGPLDIHIGVHSYSALVLCSWSYPHEDPPRVDEVRELA